MCITRHAQSTQNKFAYICSISRKAWVMKLIFYVQIKKNFYKFIVSFWVCMACPKHPKQQLYNIFAISWGKHKGWSWFFPADNCQTFLQSDTVIFDVCGQAYLDTRNKKFSISLQYLEKEVNEEVDFLHAGKHENLLQLGTMILMEMVKHFQSSQNSKFTMSVQYL